MLLFFKKRFIFSARKETKGFTLMGLLVFLAVFILIVQLFFVLLFEFQKSSRDKQRKSDILKMQSALDAYSKGVGNGRYPVQKEWACFNDFDGNQIDTLVFKNIINALPKDPKESSGEFCYYYMSDGEDYKLATQLEKDFKIMKSDGGTSDLLYEIFTKGAQNWP